MYEKSIYRFLAVLYKIKKIYFWLNGALCSAGALGPGLAGLCLKTALPNSLTALLLSIFSPTLMIVLSHCLVLKIVLDSVLLSSMIAITILSGLTAVTTVICCAHKRRKSGLYMNEHFIWRM